MSSPMTRSIRAILLTTSFLVAAAACDSAPAPSLDPIDATACQLAPLARQIPTALRAALAAAKRGDRAGVSTAAGRATALGTQIVDATRRAAAQRDSRPVV